MKPLVIAAATLALAGAAAQAESQTSPAAVTEQVEGTAAAMGDAAAKPPMMRPPPPIRPPRPPRKPLPPETTAADAAEMAEDMGEDAALAADQAAEDAAAAADQAADDAAMAADNAASGAGKAAENAAEDAGAAADEAEKAADAVTEAVPQVTPPDVNPPAISEAEPGVLSSWVTSRRIWTTGQPSATEWVDPMLQERPAEWQDIAKVNDIVLDDSGQVVGYIADIGGFLGIGAKKVLLGTDAIHLLSIGNDTFFVTNYTKQELEALPDFDEKTVRK
ncbi:MAG: PRC-barrel domain-containing protein [Paracoccus sp. (in: a-proteobacteria)]